MEFLLIFVAIFLFVLFLSVVNPGREDTLASAFETSPVKVVVHEKERKMDMKDGRPVYSYFIVASEKKKNGKTQNPQVIEIDQISYAQMRADTEVELFFDEAGKYESYRLISTRVPANR